MGIKRTATGRIYFDADDGYAEDSDSRRDDEDRSGGGLERHVQQNQVLGLLGQLGDRLQRSETDREELLREVQEYRRTVADLEEKAAKAEKIVAAMQGRVSRFEKVEAEIAKRQEALESDLPGRHKKLESEIAARQEKLEAEIARRQEGLEKSAQDQNQKIARAVQTHSDLERRIKGAETIAGALEGRIAESVEQQARLNRRLEKIGQDKVRLLRKIERMEEVVTETQEALRARAMVLLTDQTLAAAAGGVPRLSLPAPDSAANDAGRFFDRDESGDLPWWRKSVRLRAAGLAAIVAAALAGGWMFAQLAVSAGPAVQVASSDAAPQSDPDSALSGVMQAASREEDNSSPDSAVQSIDSDTPPSALATAQASFEEVPKSAHPEPALDDAELLAAYAVDPDAVAAQLNGIEPGASRTGGDAPGAKPVGATPSAAVASAPQRVAPVSVPAPAAATLDVPPLSAQEPVQVASLPAPRAAEEKRAPDSAPQPASAQPVADVRPDSALPAKFKAVETKALAGNAEAQHDLAALYTAGRDGVPQDYAKASLWFRKAAEGGVANAAYNLGVLYHQGLGTRKDMAEAIRWYRRAADKNHPEAQYNLGIAFIEGIGVAYDPRAAAKYFESAASAGIVEAAYNLGMIYENGLLGEPQPDRALVWYKTAADKGSPEARLALEQLAKTLRLDPAEIDRAAGLSATGARTAVQRPASAGGGKAPESAAAPASQVRALPGMDLPVDDVLAYPDTGVGSIDQVVVSQIQRQLRSLGLYAGAADGVMGEKTDRAIRSYQSAQGLPVDGRPSENLLVHMLAHDPGALSSDETAMGAP